MYITNETIECHIQSSDMQQRHPYKSVGKIIVFFDKWCWIDWISEGKKSGPWSPMSHHTKNKFQVVINLNMKGKT